MSIIFKPSDAFTVSREELPDPSPEPYRMVSPLDMRELMRDDVIDHMTRSHYEAPAEAEVSAGGTGPPSGAGACDIETVIFHPVRGGIEVQSLFRHNGRPLSVPPDKKLFRKRMIRSRETESPLKR